MGSKTSCQGRRCKEEAFGTCSCESILLCTSCYEIHINEFPRKVHSFTPLKPVALSEVQEITWKSIILTKLIYRSPEGSTEVHEGKLKDRLGKFAIKIMYCRGEGDLAKKQKESELQMRMKHPNICECLASFKDESQQGVDKYVIVMEFSEDGDIEQEIEKRKLKKNPWPEGEIMLHIGELIDAFAYLQDNNLTHGDIKPRNLYLTSVGKIKVGDFGESKQSMQALVTQTYQVAGTVVYFSPLLFSAYLDIIKGKNSRGDVRHNPIKSDVYSLGLSLLHMATLRKPTELNNLEIGPDTLQENVDKAIASVPYTENLRQILTHMLQVQESKRYDFKQLLRYIRPSSQDSIEEVTPRAIKPAMNSKVQELKLISISQIQGKANILDQNYRFFTMSNHKLQSSARAMIYKDSALIVGGLKSSKSVFRINVSTSAATKLNDLRFGRSWHVLLFHQGLLYAIGGRSDTKEALRSTEVLNTLSDDITKEEWMYSGELQVGRENASAISLNDKIFIFGGATNIENRWEMLGTIELFSEGRWNRVNVEMPEKCSGLGLLPSPKGTILLLGGCRGKGIYSNKIMEYDVERNRVLENPNNVLCENDFFSSLSYFSANNCMYILGNFLGCHIVEETSLKCDLNRYK